jgi:hypothetical protein
VKHFQEILTALGARNSKSLKEDKHWTLWEAEYQTPVSVIKGNYLYLKSTCPLAEATSRNLSDFGALCGPNGYHVVVTPSSDLSKDLSATNQRFKGIKTSTTQQLLQDNLLNGIKYRPLQREEYFIPPSVTLENGLLEVDGLKYLSNWLIGDASPPNQCPIGLLSADGGIGKTTLARELCERVRSKNPKVLPLLIESDQWKSIANTGFTLDTLWDIALSRRLENGNSLRSNHLALRVLMQEGLLVVIFDGFDELAAISGDGNRPQEIISELQNLFTPEDEDVRARVILTSRTTYWNSIKDGIASENQVQTFNLNGFNNEQRKKYFESRLRSEAERDTALRLSKQVAGAIFSGEGVQTDSDKLNQNRLSGTPFVLSLIAHYVEGSGNDTLNPFHADPLEPLLLGVCKRENIRQDLGITPETQMSIFEEIFRMSEGDISNKDLDLVLQIFNIDNSDVRLRFTNHFFLMRSGMETFCARFEVLRVYFIARFLAKGLQKLYATTPEKEIASALSKHFLGENQVIEWLVWQLKKLDADSLKAAIKHAFEIIQLPENIANRHRASISLFRILTHFVTEESKTERSKQLGMLLGTKRNGEMQVIERATLAGRIRSIDWSNTHFVNCTFSDIEFSSCKFGTNTKFSSCTFEGSLDFVNCQGLGDIKVVDSRLSADAEIALARVQQSTPSEKVRIDFAEEALTRALKKFKGDYGFHGIQFRRRNSSMNPRNPYINNIWDSLKRRQVVQSHTISGVTEGGLNIRDDKDLRREITQYIDNGIVGPTLQSVISDIVGINLTNNLQSNE